MTIQIVVTCIYKLFVPYHLVNLFVEEPLAKIISYVKPIAEALQYAHDHEVIHRDVKPANFLLGKVQREVNIVKQDGLSLNLVLGKDEKILLSDFGIATVNHATHSMPVEDKDIIGTLAYMAPEQFDGKPRKASDQYALGVIVYEWLRGEALFGGPSWGEYASQHKLVPPTPLETLDLGIPSSIDQVVLKALDKDYKKRFERVIDFVDALERAYSTFQEEITVWLNEPEYTVDRLRSEDVQYAIIQRSILDQEWWRNTAQARLNALRLKGEKENDITVTEVLTALAGKAKSEAITAASQKNGAAFESMLSLMISCATPASRYPELWTSLLKELTDEGTRAFVTKDETIYTQLLRQWGTLSPTIDSEIIRPWLPQSWLEFGAFFSLHLPDEWNYTALLPLLDTPIPLEALQYIEQSHIRFIEDFFRYLLAPQRHSAALRWFTQWMKSGYTEKMQGVMELVLTSPHLTTRERIEVLETNGKQLLSHFPRSRVLLDNIRTYFQALNINEPKKLSSVKAFLQSLSDLAQQLPSDVQQTVKCWRTIIAFVEQPSLERANLTGLAAAVSPLKVHSELIEALALAFISCLEDEFDLINVVHVMAPALNTQTVNSLLLSMAKQVGEQHDYIRLFPYIRFILAIEKVYDLPITGEFSRKGPFPPTNREEFVLTFLNTLFQKTSNSTFQLLHQLITSQNWPQTVLTKWDIYARKRISVFDIPQATISIRQQATIPISSRRQKARMNLWRLVLKSGFGLFSQEERYPEERYLWEMVRSPRERVLLSPLSQIIITLISILLYSALVAFFDQHTFGFFFRLLHVGSPVESYPTVLGWMLIDIFEVIPLFFGALFGPLPGCLIGGGGFAIGALISLHLGDRGLANYTYSDLYVSNGGYWFLSIYYAVTGFIAGLAFFRTQGSYEEFDNIVLAEGFGFIGVVLAFLFTLAILDVWFKAPFGSEQLTLFIPTLPCLILLPLLLAAWEKLKAALHLFLYGY